MCRALSLSTRGNKAAIFAQIRDSANPLIEQIDDKSFMYRKKKEVEVANLSLPWWVVLNPDPAPEIVGIDMLRGMQDGFFGPINIENVVGAPKHQYCCREEKKVSRPEFASMDSNLPTSDRRGVLMDAQDLLPDKFRDCCPKHFFDTQISREFVKRCIVDTTNARAAVKGAGFGGTQYTQTSSDLIWTGCTGL